MERDLRYDADGYLDMDQFDDSPTDAKTDGLVKGVLSRISPEESDELLDLSPAELDRMEAILKREAQESTKRDPRRTSDRAERMLKSLALGQRDRSSMVLSESGNRSNSQIVFAAALERRIKEWVDSLPAPATRKVLVVKEIGGLEPEDLEEALPEPAAEMEFVVIERVSFERAARASSQKWRRRQRQIVVSAAILAFAVLVAAVTLVWELTRPDSGVDGTASETTTTAAVTDTVGTVGSGQPAVGTRPPHSDVVTSMSWSPDGKRLVSGDRGGDVWIWKDGRAELHLDGNARAVTDTAWSPDGSQIATANDIELRIYDSTTDQKQARVIESKNSIGHVYWLSDDIIAAASYNDLDIIDVSEGSTLQTITHPPGAGAIAVSPNGPYLVLPGGDGLYVYAIDQGFEQKAVIKHGGDITLPGWSAAFSPDGDQLAVGGQGYVTRYDTSKEPSEWVASATLQLEVPEQITEAVAFDQAGSIYYAISSGLYKWGAGTPAAALVKNRDGHVAVSSTTGQIAFGTYEGKIEFFNE